jgi:hypothetical protein
MLNGPFYMQLEISCGEHWSIAGEAEPNFRSRKNPDPDLSTDNGRRKPKATEAGKHRRRGQEQGKRTVGRNGTAARPGHTLPTDGTRARARTDSSSYILQRLKGARADAADLFRGAARASAPRPFGFLSRFSGSLQTSFTTTSPSLFHQQSPLTVVKMSSQQPKPNVMGMPVCPD